MTNETEKKDPCPQCHEFDCMMKIKTAICFEECRREQPDFSNDAEVDAFFDGCYGCRIDQAAFEGLCDICKAKGCEHFEAPWPRGP